MISDHTSFDKTCIRNDTPHRTCVKLVWSSTHFEKRQKFEKQKSVPKIKISFVKENKKFLLFP